MKHALKSCITLQPNLFFPSGNFNPSWLALSFFFCVGTHHLLTWYVIIYLICLPLIIFLLVVEYKPLWIGLPVPVFGSPICPQIPSEPFLCSALYLRGADLHRLHSPAPRSVTLDQREPGHLKLVGKVDIISFTPTIPWPSTILMLLEKSLMLSVF